MCRIIVSRCKFAKLQVVHEENNNNRKIQFNHNSGPGLWQQATKQRKNPPSSSPGSGSEVLLNNPRNSNLNINSSASEWKTHCIRKTAIFNNAWLAWHEPEQLAASIQQCSMRLAIIKTPRWAVLVPHIPRPVYGMSYSVITHPARFPDHNQPLAVDP